MGSSTLSSCPDYAALILLRFSYFLCEPVTFQYRGSEAPDCVVLHIYHLTIPLGLCKTSQLLDAYKSIHRVGVISVDPRHDARLSRPNRAQQPFGILSDCWHVKLMHTHSMITAELRDDIKNSTRRVSFLTIMFQPVRVRHGRSKALAYVPTPLQDHLDYTKALLILTYLCFHSRFDELENLDSIQV